MISNGYQIVYFRPHNDKTNLSLFIIVYQISPPYFRLKIISITFATQIVQTLFVQTICVNTFFVLYLLQRN